jgi:hypothetical protein
MPNDSHRLVALMDVIGYRYLLKMDRDNGTEDFKSRLTKSLDVLSSINESDMSHQAISDTLIIAGSGGMQLSEFISIVARVQRSFLYNGLLLRGGMAFEQHFKAGNVTYSNALAIAYELEKKQAIYPRVVVDRSVVEMARVGDRFSLEDVSRVTEERLLLEQDGVYFVNFADSHVDECFDHARSIYEGSRDKILGSESEVLKHRWLQDYVCAISAAGKEPYLGMLNPVSLVADDSD